MCSNSYEKNVFFFHKSVDAVEGFAIQFFQLAFKINAFFLLQSTYKIYCLIPTIKENFSCINFKSTDASKLRNDNEFLYEVGEAMFSYF